MITAGAESVAVERRAVRPLGRSAVLVGYATVLASGCFPHVMHGPRIEDDGWSGSQSLTIGRNLEIGDGSRSMVPSLYVGLRRSILPADGNGRSASIGLQVPVLIAPLFFGQDEGLRALAATSYLDVYVQPMRRQEPGWEWGVGGMASSAIAGPYVQVGRMRAGGSGWFTTHMVLVPASDDITGHTYYMPSVAYRHRDEGGRSAASFSAGLGMGFGERRTETLFLFGVALELGLDRN